MRLSYSLVIANLLNPYSCTCPLGKRLLGTKSSSSYVLPTCPPIFFYLLSSFCFSAIGRHTNPKLMKFKCDYHTCEDALKLTQTHSLSLHIYARTHTQTHRLFYDFDIISARFLLCLFLLASKVGLHKLAHSHESESHHLSFSKLLLAIQYCVITIDQQY